jgi:stress-induced morphogen|tara:strand:- start:209 stop:547 length:339 start_codon:yes stop_codon:yes gene_type:complete
MKSNAVYEIENRLKEAFSPTYLMIEESTLVEKKYKVLIAANHFHNQVANADDKDNHKHVFQALKDIIRVNQPIVRELDIATADPFEFDHTKDRDYGTYKYSDMLEKFSTGLR